MEEYITGTGQILSVHEKAVCSGQCCIHNPTEHHMRGFPTHWRDDRGIMERICPHGVGHPDLDELRIRSGDDPGFHGCDGCCVEWKINGSYSAWVAKGYAVTKDGRAWSFWRSEGPKKANKSVVDMNIPPRQLAPRLSRHGYSRIQINRKDFAVHKLVLTAWRGPPREDQETRHLNGIRSDNRLENLAWGTHDENHEDKVSHGNLITGTDHPNSKLTVKLVVDARKLWLAGKTLPQIIEKLNLTVSKASIHEAIVGKTWQHVTEIPPVLNRGRISKKEKP